MLFKSLKMVTVLALSQASAIRNLPQGSLIVGYTATCETEKIIDAVKQGVNVLAWFSIALVNNEGVPAVIPNAVQPLPDLDCIASTISQIRSLGLETTHMVTIGGWGAEHPTTDFTSAEMYAAIKSWNEEVVASYGITNGFDGFDWDIEGANAASSPNNYLTNDLLDLIGQTSQLAKKDGYIVSMVPCESYLDPTTSEYDGSLLHSYPEWEPYVQFNYHGRNGLASLLAKYGSTVIQDGSSVDTFDYVMIGLYETFSHADYFITAAPIETRQTPAEYLTNWVPSVYQGWMVDFSSDSTLGLESQRVSVKKSQLVVGFGNGWCNNIVTDQSYARSVLIMPEEAGEAYKTLFSQGLEPRGFGFWSIHEEGFIPKGHTDQLYMAEGLNQFLKIRESSFFLE